jgi:sugar-specific transcriptional regulator TrmB
VRHKEDCKEDVEKKKEIVGQEEEESANDMNKYSAVTIEDFRELFNLTKYESIFLFRLVSSNKQSITYSEAGIPRPKVYDVADQLEAKGFLFQEEKYKRLFTFNKNWLKRQVKDFSDILSKRSLMMASLQKDTRRSDDRCKKQKKQKGSKK